jgi:hypothetical protein
MCSYVLVEAGCIFRYIRSCPLAGINQWASTLLHGVVDDKGEKASYEKGAEDHPRHSLLSSTHCAARKGRTFPEKAEARRLSGRVVGGRDRGVEGLASTRCVIAVSVLGQGAPEVHTSAPLHFSNPMCGNLTLIRAALPRDRCRYARRVTSDQ